MMHISGASKPPGLTVILQDNKEISPDELLRYYRSPFSVQFGGTYDQYAKVFPGC